MAKHIYALLVGINDYPVNVGKLAGCLNDVDHFHDYLKSTIDPSALAVEVLKDAEATRQNIIAQFREHLGKAEQDDVAVFHYCGHGARWASAPEFKKFYADGMDEGLVCVDSRLDKGYDLADKELALLISELAKNNPHLAVILDCCHSGSGTRGADAFMGMRPRVTHEVSTPRPLESYLDGYYAKNNPLLAIPTSKHILLAACERTQLAQEAPDKCGVFTSALIETLTKSGRNLTYSDLFVRCRAAVRTRALSQTPQFETHGNFPASSGFLGADPASSARRYRASVNQLQWTVQCGAIHGVPTEAEKPIPLALYLEQAPTRQAGTATITRVGAHSSEIELAFESDPTASYSAEITSLPVPPLEFYCNADAPTMAALREVFDNDPSQAILLTDVESNAHYELRVDGGKLRLNQRETGLYIQGADLTDPKALLPAMRSIVQWERSQHLQNSRTKMDTSKVEFYYEETLPNGEVHKYPAGEIILDYVEGDVKNGPLKVRNGTYQQLNMALAYFSDDFGIYVLLNEPVPPGGVQIMWPVKPNDSMELDTQANQSLEKFKLIVSTEKFDDFLFKQAPIALGQDAPETPETPENAATRGLASLKIDPYRNEWFTKDCRIKLVRRLNQVGPQDATLAGGKIVVKAHKSLQANLSLSGVTATGRDVGGGFYRAFNRPDMQLLNFATGGDNESVMEITDIQNAAALQQDPLLIEFDMSLEDGKEGLLPLVYDGQHVLLTGSPYKDESGKTIIAIDHIPDVADKRRSLGGSLKLYFFKTYLKQDNLNQLRWVEYKPDGSPAYQQSNLAGKVAAAKNILLLVHGIIGDTENMAKGVKTCGLDQHFDLVLTYDYENLTTPIGDTAQLLKSQLAAAGLHESDGKQLTMLVHSMGGLVSRWFIEQLGGNKIVDHLVMCGTPNNGSPFGKVQDAVKVMSLLTTISMNYVPWLIPHASAVLFLLNRSKNLTPTLQQMNPSSDFIKALNSSPDPGIPYTILAGDTSQYNDSRDQFFGQLLAKVGRSTAFEALFSMQPNDIAVGVESILGVGGSRAIAPKLGNVACHHLNYFDSDAGTVALTQVEWRKS